MTGPRKRPPLKLSFEYMDTPERRVVSLEPDGIWCLPVLGYDCYRKQWAQPPFHVHEECLEVTLCLRGELEFGQPHRSLEEAAAYVRTFTKKVPEEELLPWVQAHAVPTGREDFPLYTPKKRGFGIFVIGRKENEQLS